MDTEFSKHLKILLDPDIDVNIKKQSVEFCIGWFKKGEDISAAIPALLDLFHYSHQVPVMDVAGRAIVAYYLHNQDYQAIIDFIKNEEYKSYSLSSIIWNIGEGADITPILPMLFQFFKNEEYSMKALVCSYITIVPKNSSQRAKEVAELMYNHPIGHKFLPFLVKEMAIDHENTYPFIPFLGSLLRKKDSKFKEEVLTALWWATEGGADLTAIISDLEIELNSDSEFARQAAYNLAYNYIHNQMWDKIEPLLSHSTVIVRYSAIRALGVHLNSSKKKKRDVFLYLLKNFGDSEPANRQLVLNSLMEAERKQQDILPPSGEIALFTPILLSMDNNPELVQYLFHISERSNEILNSLIQLLSSFPSNSRNLVSSLLQMLQQFQSGNLRHVCSICRNIPRKQTYYSESDLPKEFTQLNLPPPTLGSDSQIAKCPECGSEYFYEYIEEYDDMSLDTRIELRRLDLLEMRSNLTESEKNVFDARISSLIVKYKMELQHPVDFQRTEAVWHLFRYFMKVGNWTEIHFLLQLQEELLLSTILQELQSLTIPSDGFNLIKDDLIHLLHNLKDHMDRFRVACVLADDLIKRRDYLGIDQYLKDDDPSVVNGITYKIWLSVRSIPFDINPIRPQLNVFTKSKNKDIRFNVMNALEEAEALSKQIDFTASEQKSGKKTKINLIQSSDASKHGTALEIMIQNLDESDVEVQKDALTAMEKLIVKGADISSALPRIIELLKVPALDYYTASILKKIVWHSKISISKAIPGLIEILNKFDHHNISDITIILYELMKKGENLTPFFNDLGKLMTGSSTNLRSALVPIFELALTQGKDISSIEPYLAKLIANFPETHDYYTEFFIKAAATVYLKTRNWEKLDALLKHPNNNIPGPAASALAHVKEDFSPVLPSLVHNLLHEYWYIRECASDAINQLALISTESTKRIYQELIQITIPKKLSRKKKEIYDRILSNFQSIMKKMEKTH